MKGARTAFTHDEIASIMTRVAVVTVEKVGGRQRRIVGTLTTAKIKRKKKKKKKKKGMTISPGNLPCAVLSPL
jgi:hypothetical protein